MSGYQIKNTCQEPTLYDFFTNTPVPIADLKGDVIILINRASTPAQETAHDSKFAYMTTIIGSIGKRIIKRTYNESGRLIPIYAFNDSHGLDHGYRNTWFGFLEDCVNEVLNQPYCFPGQRITIILLTPDRLARPPYPHRRYWHTQELTETDYKQFDEWKRAKLDKQHHHVRFLTCFAGTPGQCRGLQTEINMNYYGKLGGRPKGSRNKKPRMPKQTPKQITEFRNMLQNDIPHLVNELGLNGTQCYNYLKAHHGGYIPITRKTVCKWVAKERGTPGKSGKPAAKPMQPAPEIRPENKCNLLTHHPAYPFRQYPVLSSAIRTRDTGRPILTKRVNLHVISLSLSTILKRLCPPPLSRSQRAMAAHDAWEISKKSGSVPRATLDTVAEQFKVSKTTIQYAGIVKERASEATLQAIRDGKEKLKPIAIALKKSIKAKQDFNSRMHPDKIDEQRWQSNIREMQAIISSTERLPILLKDSDYLCVNPDQETTLIKHIDVLFETIEDMKVQVERKDKPDMTAVKKSIADLVEKHFPDIEPAIQWILQQR